MARCDDDCRTALVFGRQTRLALNNEMTRVQRVFLATGNCCDTEYFAREQAGLDRARRVRARGAGAARAVSRRARDTRCTSSIRSAIS